jgi:hypothetical protein
LVHTEYYDEQDVHGGPCSHVVVIVVIISRTALPSGYGSTVPVAVGRYTGAVDYHSCYHHHHHYYYHIRERHFGAAATTIHDWNPTPTTAASASAPHGHYRSTSFGTILSRGVAGGFRAGYGGY